VQMYETADIRYAMLVQTQVVF